MKCWGNDQSCQGSTVYKLLALLPPINEVWAKAMFLHLSVPKGGGVLWCHFLLWIAPHPRQHHSPGQNLPLDNPSCPPRTPPPLEVLSRAKHLSPPQHHPLDSNPCPLPLDSTTPGWQHPLPPGQHLPPPDSGWYVSYWNVFLLVFYVFSGLHDYGRNKGRMVQWN